RRHSAWKADALPTELLPQIFKKFPKKEILNPKYQKNLLPNANQQKPNPLKIRHLKIQGFQIVGRAGFEPAKT
ncbi:hypothetical protein, partial [uncultured Kriegella sp.]|uniref:hypothetical protein n=1 Tax=uncultured Kriegella sp. TaxID=1798910 RepID=UPI0030DA4FE8